tara:strand:- start:448 stop:651 length:204 start_codon:yes stop_codon:yes gene_type:complete
MARDPFINTVTGQRRVIRKKGDLTTGKGDWIRGELCDEKYKKNYDKIFGKKNLLVENKVIAKDESTK